MTKNGNSIREWTIYKVTSPSGNVYVGRTINYKMRLAQYNHVGTTKQQPLLYNSFRKYGKEAHKFDIIERFNGDLSVANDKEMFWIRSYMSNICKWREGNGLNLTDGGEGTFGYKQPKEAVERMAARFRGKKLSKRHKEKLSIITKERGNLKLGTAQRSETKEKISLALKGHKMSSKRLEDNLKSRERRREMYVLATSNDGGTEEKFNTIIEAERRFNLKRGTLSRYINGLREQKGNVLNTGFTFCFKEREIKLKKSGYIKKKDRVQYGN